MKGLSRTELNGKDGIVEKEYNHINGRIGVALVDEATGDRRVIGVKPINLDLLEEDSHFVIDTKVMLAEILCRCLFVRQNCTLPWLPTVLHMLRGIVATLCMEFDNADNDLFAGEDVHSNTFLYSSDVHRLVFAENYLGFLLSFFAKYIAMRMVPIDFGGLVCRRYDDVLQMLNHMPAGVDDEERKMGEVLFISQFYMEEAVKVLARSEKHVEWLRENNKKESDGEIILMNALVSGTLHEIAGVSSKGLEFAMVPLNKRDTRSLIGERAEQNAKDHLMVAIAFLRTQFESLMHAYVELKEDDGPLTVRTFCSNDTFPQFFPVTLIYLLHTITEIFVETGAMWTEDFFPNGESEDKTMLITFALFVSTNSLGLGHPMTKRVGFLYEKISGDASWGVGRNSIFDELESSVNVWLESYAPLYFNTSRQHPALYCQLADLDPPDFLQDITS
uniref:Uncharacterized protein n=1 Tax=Minutocellus polymorphus TaxID=265543 RepID=A0A7S0FII0_9STRA